MAFVDAPKEEARVDARGSRAVVVDGRRKAADDGFGVGIPVALAPEGAEEELAVGSPFLGLCGFVRG